MDPYSDRLSDDLEVVGEWANDSDPAVRQWATNIRLRLQDELKAARQEEAEEAIA